MIRTIFILINWLCFILVADLSSQTSASVWFDDAAGETNSVVTFPLQISTDSTITFAQFIVEFDSTVVSPLTSLVEVGDDAAGFTLGNINAALPFPPTATGANKNMLIQISGGGDTFFSGDSIEVLRLKFFVVGRYQETSPLAFDAAGGRTVLTTPNLTDLQEEAIEFRAGSLTVADETPPVEFDLLFPQDGSWTNDGLPTLSWNLTTDASSGVAFYELHINSALNVGAIPPGQNSAAPASELMDADHSWKIVAVDSAGNRRESTTSRLLRVDKTAPESEITNPIPNQDVTGTISISGTATDGPGIGVDSVLVSTDDGQTWQAAESTSGAFTTWQYRWQVSQNGPISILTMAADSLGNAEVPHGIIVTDVEERAAQIPTEFALLQNYPNPFNPSTTITFALPAGADVRLAIYNLQGQLVKKLVAGKMAAGHHAIVWNGDDVFGANVSTGTYIYRMQAGQFVATRRLLLLK